MHLLGREVLRHTGDFLLVDNNFSLIIEKSASDQLRQMCLSQLTASEELAQVEITARTVGYCM